MPAKSAPPIALHNGDPEDPFWWTGVRPTHLAIPANLTRGLSIIINPLIRLPWTFTTGPIPPWCLDPMAMNGARPGVADAGTRVFLSRESRFDFWARWVRDAILHGMALFSYTPDSVGQPSQGTLIRHAPTNLLAPIDEWEEDWILLWHNDRYNVDERGNILGTNRRIHFMRGHEGGVIGQHAAELKAANGVTEYAANLFDGNVPSGVLTTDQPINQTQADATRAEWESTQYRRRIAVLGNGAKYQQVVMSPVDAAVGSMMTLSNTQVAHMLELPSWMLDGITGDSGIYSNINDRRTDFIDGTLSAWSARIEESISALLPWGQKMAIDFTEYRRPTMTVATGAAQNVAEKVQEADNAPDPA